MRAIWKGSIDFGLVNIPVKLYSGESPEQVNFDLLDKRDFSRVRYRRVNEKTGREVPWKEIVKGYPYGKGEYVALSDQDFAQANVEATQTITITDFVDAAEVSPIYFDKPYYLEPLKSGRRAYALFTTMTARCTIPAGWAPDLPKNHWPICAPGSINSANVSVLSSKHCLGGNRKAFIG